MRESTDKNQQDPSLQMTMRLSRPVLYTLIIVAAAGLSSCSTKKNTLTRRVYHNLTAHYNTYFNGNESLKEGRKDLRKKAVDDYNTVLPVENFGTEKDAQAIFPQMDKAIDKGVKTVSMHSMYFKNVEYCRWIDDSYMMIGKAYFYKRDFEMAGRTFDFVMKRYRQNDIKWDAMIWLARNHTRREEFDQALSILDMVNDKLESGEMPKKYARDLSLAFAEHYISQNNYPPAIEHLLKAIPLMHKKTDKNRLRFILAQIYQGTGQLAEATQLYGKVIRKNPPYEMAFRAMINRAKCFDAATGDSKAIEKQLNKMLADDKNKEYLDQIYFALAELAMKRKDEPKVIEYLTLSVKNSVSNDYQKGLSALYLADLYFEKPKYVPAQAFYDSAVQYLPKDYGNYETIEQKSLILNELVGYIVTVETEDSLQRLAQMSEKERDAVISKKIAQIQEQERLARMNEGSMRQGLGFIEQANRERNLNAQSGTNWYFYNPTALSFGFTEFTKKWGRRKLEDNWRLSNKVPVANFGTDPALATDSANLDSNAVVLVTDPKDKNFYLQHIPLTDDKMAASHAKVKDALYKLGLLYDERFNDLPKAILSFDTLIDRYPGDSAYVLKSSYQLYRLYAELGQSALSGSFRDKIVKEYPESDYARIILDPDYYKKLAEELGREKRLYSEAYVAFRSNDHARVLKLAQEARTEYDDRELIPRFLFLEALTLGKTRNAGTMKSSLEELVAAYPSHAVTPLARDILNRMNGGDSTVVSSDQTLSASSGPGSPVALYAPDPSAIHLFVMVADIKNTNINALKIRLSDFNQKFFSLEKLTVSSLFLDDTHQMITVSNFKGSSEGIKYYQTVKENAYVNSQLEGSQYEQFIITVGNYPTLYRDKSVDTYMKFFRENYLK
ncbi:MAG TPA: tetratricopeptide repeat protein [Bacteroidales bacterium]|nr:tetratricopeptide repeat protein [Bacteroidales bacterium]HRZ75791.1 tetratricopeptide repeat protein [Bacteroidales bacterium]